ncbi:hypothetical protein [Baekduia alba]|uniref:hypothetical protein n=1 Tax=Baekduia alba TaxID=2997333 RepID=UPI002340406F|nr:hypothetical protein [Baekduia alba]
MVVVAVVLLGGGGEDKGAAVADPLAEALSFAPASAPAVAQFDVQSSSPQGRRLRELARTFPAARFAADGVRESVRTLGLDADQDLPDLLGGPLVAWGPPDAITSLAASISSLRLELAPVLKAGVTAAVVGRSADDVEATLERAADDGRLKKTTSNTYTLPANAGVIGVKGPDVVLGANHQTVAAAFRLHDNKGGLTRATFDQRLGPLAKEPALVRAWTNARAIVASSAAGVPWVDALRGGALTLAIEKPGVHLKVHLATDPAHLTDQDLPLAPGPQPPRPAPGPRPIHAGIRGLAQTIKVLDAARNDLKLPFLKSITNALDTLDSVKGPLKTFGRIDVDDALIDQLTGTTTITPEPRPNTLALRAELEDGGPLRTALDRIAAVPDFALDLANVDLDVDRDGDAYAITSNGKAILKAAVLGNTLVVTNDLTADLQAIADRRPTTVAARGALELHADDQAVQDEVIRRFDLPGLARLVLGGFGDLDATAEASRAGTDLDATLTLNE